MSLPSNLSATANPHFAGSQVRHGWFSGPHPGMVWLMTRWALAQVTADLETRSRLGNAPVYEILRPGQQLLPGLDAVPVATFSALSALAASIACAELPAGTRAILYDPEAWSFTPAGEQRDPGQAAAEAGILARSNGLRLIVAPALNLVTVMAPASKGPRWSRFLDLGIAAAAATVADVIELQAQSLERDAAVYSSFVRAAAGQARAANPQVYVLAGLSTNPPGDPVNSQQLIEAVQATRTVVDGYWVNIPGRGPRCPTCNPPQPRLGIELLREFL